MPHLGLATRLLVLAALLLTVLIAMPIGLVAAPAPTAAPVHDRWYAAADEEAGLELVAATYNVLQDRFFRPLDSRTLLDAAWDSARGALGQQRRLPNGIVAPELSGDREDDLARFSIQYRALLTAAGPGIDGIKVAMAASDAMTDSVKEQHTAFLEPEQFARFRSSLTGDQGTVGVGILIDGQRGPFTIADVFPGAPAAQAGIQPGDQIERVDGRDTTRLELRELSSALRGEAGQPVTLTLRRGGQTLDVTVVRALYQIPSLRSRLLPEGICHLRLSAFPAFFIVSGTGRTIAEDLDAALEACEQGGARGWIMDLRGNGGGSTLTLSQLLGRFMDNGPISVDRDRVGGRYESATDGHLFRVQRPLVVLIDGGSASASEVFASAVQEYKRGVLVGQRTAGVLNGAQVVPLPLDAGLSVATREVFTGVQEIVVDGVGVSPDVEVARDPDPNAVPRRAIELALSPPAGVGPLEAPPPAPVGAVLSEAELRRILEPIQLRAEDAERPEDARVQGDLVVDTLNFYAGDTPNLGAGRDRALRLGWRGGMTRFLGNGFPPPFSMDIQLYRDADGAHRDFREIYEPGEPRNPTQLRDVEPPVRVGDDVRALIGTGQNEGRVWIAWRRGSATFVVSRNLLPGEPPTFAELTRLAEIADARAAAAGL